MISKQAKRKNVIKKLQHSKEKENTSAGSRIWFICLSRQLPDHCTTVQLIFFGEVSLLYLKHFSLPTTPFEAGGAVFIVN